MATGFTNPFVSGANLNVTPRLMTAYEEWRQDACALEARRVERDLGGFDRNVKASRTRKTGGNSIPLRRPSCATSEQIPIAAQRCSDSS